MEEGGGGKKKNYRGVMMRGRGVPKEVRKILILSPKKVLFNGALKWFFFINWKFTYPFLQKRFINTQVKSQNVLLGWRTVEIHEAHEPAIICTFQVLDIRFWKSRTVNRWSVYFFKEEYYCRRSKTWLLELR